MSPPKKKKNKIMMIVESSKGFKHPCHIVSRFLVSAENGAPSEMERSATKTSRSTIGSGT